MKTYGWSCAAGAWCWRCWRSFAPSSTESGVEIDEGTLYPLLRRLESQGLLVSEWREEDKRNKRFYKISRDGKTVLKLLQAEWQSIGLSLEEIFKES